MGATYDKKGGSMSKPKKHKKSFSHRMFSGYVAHVQRRSICTAPDKKYTFDSRIDALIFIANSGLELTPYKCRCGKWHNTSQK